MRISHINSKIFNMKEEMKKLLSYKWRISRKEYLKRLFLINMILILFVWLLFLASAISNNSIVITSTLAYIFWIALLVLFIAAKVERLHDMNIRWMFVALQVVAILWLFYYCVDLYFWLDWKNWKMNPLLVVSILVIIVIWWTLIFKKWTEWENKYWEDPLIKNKEKA